MKMERVGDMVEPGSTRESWFMGVLNKILIDCYWKTDVHKNAFIYVRMADCLGTDAGFNAVSIKYALFSTDAALGRSSEIWL